MAVSRNQRLKKQSAKANKRKAVVAEKLAAQRRELSISKPRHVDLSASPIADCLLSKDFEGDGLASVLLSRKISLGRYAVAVFLVDFWCLGIKDAFFNVIEGDDYPEFLAAEAARLPMAPVDPGYARKLVRDASAYGAANGFPPLDTFIELERLFGDVAASPDEFVFGESGKPHYVIGPNDSPRYERYVLDTLEMKFGPDGYFVTYPLEEGEED